MRYSPDDYVRALSYAALAHRDQKVPGQPYSYVVHLTNVAVEILAVLPEEPLADAELAVQCALLHDVLEDTATGAEALEAAFGAAVRRGVEALTKNKSLPKAEQMPDSLRRIQDQPFEIGMVKMADRIANLAPPPPHWEAKKIVTYREEAAAILNALGPCSSPLAKRLEGKIEEYRRFAERDD